jgi:hypothetical protein
MVSVKAALPAMVDVGLRLVRVGAGVTTSSTSGVAPPVVLTVTLAVPAIVLTVRLAVFGVVIRLAGTMTVSCVVLT